MLPERIAARSRRRLTEVRAARLIDALIDQAHRDWPDACFVIGLPSGEDVFLPAHRSGGTPCPLGHAGYFRDRVRPFCEVDPTLHAGFCRITPLAFDQDPPTAPASAYQLSLSSGTITATGQPTATPHRLRGPVSDR